MSKETSEMTSEEIKSAVKDAHAGLANRTDDGCATSGCGPQTVQSSCCGPVEPAESSQEPRPKK